MVRYYLISMLIGILVFIGLSILILSHEAGHFFVAKLFGMKIDEFGFGFPPRIFAGKKGETEYSFNWLPLGGFVKIAGENDALSGMPEGENISAEEKKRYFSFQPAWRRVLVILAGVTVNFISGWFLLSAVIMIGTPPVLFVSQVQSASPAEKAGIMPGDIIRNYTAADNFISFITAHRGESIKIDVVRDGKDISFTAVPKIKVGNNEGALGAGLSEGGEPRKGFLTAVEEGWKRAVYISASTFSAFYQLAKNLLLHGKLLAGVVGPVGIFSVAEQIGRNGLIYLVQLVSIISLNLAVINLIPFPALDGGRFFLIIAEKIKGSPIPKKIEAVINGVGFALLLFLMFVLTIRDVTRWF